MKKKSYLEQVTIPAFIPTSRASYWVNRETSFIVPNYLVSAYIKGKFDLEMSIKRLEEHLSASGQIEVQTYV